MKLSLAHVIAIAGAAAGVACAPAPTTRDAPSPVQVDSAVVVLPTSGAAAAMQAGCWASFYDERGFTGDSLTLIGPVELSALDRGSARQLRRDVKSIVTGPRATLTVYEKQLFSSRYVAFAPASRETSVIEKLGFGGRIESMQPRCS